MNNSLKLFSIRGIDIRLHVTFPLILLWAGLQFGMTSGAISGAVFGIIAVSFLFLLVTLHELGHSFAAQYYGVTVKQIVLTPIGGVAQLARIPEKPVQELLIALAGPAVNVLIALLMGAAVLGSGLTIANPLAVLSGVSGFTLSALFSYIFVYNILLAAFNMLPAFPLDGGRALRALLALRLDYVRATNIAATIGRGAAILMGLYAIFNGGLFLVIIAAFIFMAGRQEEQYVRMRHRLRGHRVRQVYSSSVHRLSPDSSVQQATNLMIFGGQKNFPIVEGDALVGFLPQKDLLSAARTAAPHTRLASVMRHDVKPVSCEDDLFEVQQRLIEEQIGALPVVSDGRLLGLVTRRQINDLHRLLAVAPNVIVQNQTTQNAN